jgi:hypothetical protein
MKIKAAIQFSTSTGRAQKNRRSPKLVTVHVKQKEFPTTPRLERVRPPLIAFLRG